MPLLKVIITIFLSLQLNTIINPTYTYLGPTAVVSSCTVTANRPGEGGGGEGELFLLAGNGGVKPCNEVVPPFYHMDSSFLS